MAKFNEILTGRHNKFFTRLFSMKGPAPAPQLAGEVMPVQPFFHGAENRFLESWNRFTSAAFIPAVAAQDSAVMFRNPPLSNVIGVIERLSVSESVADTDIFITQDTNKPQLSTAFGIRSLDNRAVGGSTTTLGSICQVSGQPNFAVTGGFIARLGVAASLDYSLIVQPFQEITVLPNDVVEVVTSNVNVNLHVNFMWRERALEESELRQ